MCASQTVMSLNGLSGRHIQIRWLTSTDTPAIDTKHQNEHSLDLESSVKQLYSQKSQLIIYITVFTPPGPFSGHPCPTSPQTCLPSPSPFLSTHEDPTTSQRSSPHSSHPQDSQHSLHSPKIYSLAVISPLLLSPTPRYVITCKHWDRIGNAELLDQALHRIDMPGYTQARLRQTVPVEKKGVAKAAN